MTLPNRISSRMGVAILAIPILVLLVLVVFLPPDGAERATWAQFIGRFHPLVVHLPIALILLVPVMELVGREQRFEYLRASALFVLILALISGIVASLLGWCLGRSGGFSGPLVTQHMWGAASLLTLSWLCWMSRGRGGRLEAIYPIALAAAVVAVGWTGYRGGQISLGEHHLTEFMPGPLRKVLGVTAETATDPSIGGPGTFYGARIQPILAAQCLNCHSSEKRKAGLRLDNYAAVIRGGKHGPVVKPGDVGGSDLFHRITLSSSDDNFMPKGGKPPLSTDQKKLIELWIAGGASGTALLDSIKGAPAGSESSARVEVIFERIDFAEVAKRRAEVAPTLATLQQRFPNVLDYESRGSADLVLNASVMGERFTDDDLAALAPLSQHVVSADLSRTAITDRSAPILAGMKRLRLLRLMHTRIGDPTVQSLAGLDQLESLSVFDTPVTSAALPALERLPHLRRVYAGETKVSAANSSQLKEKLLF
jgi:uncharacterized membrane protein